MMKPSTSSTSCQHRDLNVAMFMDGTEFDETEFEVAEILLQLPRLVFESESLHQLSWGRKIRRYSTTDHPSLPPVGSNFIPEIEKSKALSPATPLSFSPSECDDKSKQSKRKASLKKKKEDLLGTIKELTKHKECLKEEIKNLKRHYDEQKLLNLSLKAKKQMLILGLPKEDSSSQPNLNQAAMLNIPDEKQQHQQSSYLVHHPPLIMDNTAYTNSCEERVLDIGARLFDQNLLPAECGGGQIEAVKVRGVNKSEKRALAAQARHRRMQIRRFKKHNVRLVSCKLEKISRFCLRRSCQL